jgi:hypothetical protein
MHNQSSCYLCANRPATTREHVIAKAFFPQPIPSMLKPLLTLPACQQCNQSYSDDEQYFATQLSLIDAPQYHQLGGSVFQRLRRGFRKRPTDLRKILQRVQGNVPVLTLAGIFLGYAARTTFDGNKTSRVLEKIARGLFFHHTGTLPDPIKSPTINFLTQDRLRRATLEQLGYDAWQKAQFCNAWDPYFRYQGYVDPAGEGSIWWLRFYSYHLGIVLYEFKNLSNELHIAPDGPTGPVIP